jgi:hypothetical protein
MVNLVGRLRLLIGDPAGAGAHFTDEALEGFLDGWCTEHRYLELTPVPTINEGGTVQFLEYAALMRRERRDGLGPGTPIGDWEEDAALYGPDYAEITPEASDWVRGRWRFAAHQPAQVSIVGRSYDLCGAGADALEAWAAAVKSEYDLRSGDQTMARGMQVGQILAMAATLRRRARVMAGRITRSDLC